MCVSALRTGGVAREPSGLHAWRRRADAWAPVEVVCHLRDLDESFHERVRLILTTDAPRFVPRRAETLAMFRGVSADAWTRAGWQLDSRGRRTVDDFLTLMAWHDDNHVAQLARALVGDV